MPHEYFCRACDAVSPEQRESEADAGHDLDEHRRTSHGGLRPAAGDGVRRVHSEARGDGILPARWPWAFLFLLGLLLANCSGMLGR
jgi:hypothetical protein